MPDVFNARKRSEVMSLIRGRGNKDTELELIQIMRAHRLSGWRRNFRLFGKPDFVFPKQRVAIFVDGCFWHRCYIPKHAPLPQARRLWWAAKFDRNKRRDKQVSARLRREGWRVLRIWEHALKQPDAVARRIRRMLDKQRLS
jgi:DNA mismatch endonuclease, patch repair protein